MASTINYCKVDGCEDRCHGRGYCNKHYRQFMRNGRVLDMTPSQVGIHKGKQKGDYSSEYKGVSWQTGKQKWKSAINMKGKQIFLGRYDCEIQAARAYDAAAILYFGSRYATLNNA